MGMYESAAIVALMAILLLGLVFVLAVKAANEKAVEDRKEAEKNGEQIARRFIDAGIVKGRIS